ncbi:hypothetical protein CSKR_104248 [Clonorchis sinensis]|uniref:Uncharacterized protein n=1 Tax=Clonorchis sinensis TaxID=79923 RepID=A0A419QCM7_CLOSI|nr:hypothetical protein CSKR_104248 [Clonorchis sinensis]
MPPERSTRAGILPGSPSLGRGSRDAEVGFEPHLPVKGWPPLYFRHSELGIENSTLFGKRWLGIRAILCCHHLTAASLNLSVLRSQSFSRPAPPIFLKFQFRFANRSIFLLSPGLPALGILLRFLLLQMLMLFGFSGLGLTFIYSKLYNVPHLCFIHTYLFSMY